MCSLVPTQSTAAVSSALIREQGDTVPSSVSGPVVPELIATDGVITVNICSARAIQSRTIVEHEHDNTRQILGWIFCAIGNVVLSLVICKMVIM